MREVGLGTPKCSSDSCESLASVLELEAECCRFGLVDRSITIGMNVIRFVLSHSVRRNFVLPDCVRAQVIRDAGRKVIGTLY